VNEQITTWSSTSPTDFGTVVDSVSSKSGNANTGSAMNISATPVRSITITKTFISGLSHGASEPNPVVVNVSTTTCSEWRKVMGSPSKTRIPCR